MTCIIATRPLWEYNLVWFLFFIACLGLVWVLRDQWIHRKEFNARWVIWLMQHPKSVTKHPRLARLSYMLLRPANWWGRRCHNILLGVNAPLLLLFTWITGAIFVNTIIYLVDIRAGMIHC
jgi:hypothetical protein